MVEVKRKPNESTGSMLRRFSRFVQQSGVLLRKKSLKYRPKKLTERQEKNKAIMGMHLKKLRQNLEKLGKYNEDNFEEAKRRLKQEIEL
jgi:ribosomal protein S21